jgi:hypothetical protein
MTKLFKNQDIRFETARWFSFVNRAMENLANNSTALDEKTAAVLIELASRKMSLEDFGNPRFKKGLGVLLNAVAAENKFSPVGQRILKRTIYKYLINRLLIRRTIRQEPEILRGKLNRPLFIVGLNRTATTMLHNLLALCSNVRAPRTWELMQPAPPCTAGSREARRRRRRANLMLWILHKALPGFRFVHPIEVDAAEECYPFINHTFTSPAFVMHFGVHEYAHWLDDLDMDHERWVYQEYTTQLKILQAGQPQKRWVLKSAVHLYFLGALLKEIPNALIVQTHRDPRQMIPSICSLVSCFRNLVYARLQPETVGVECLKFVKKTLERGYQARKQNPNAQIVDIHFDELVTNPIRQVRQIHERFGLEWDPFYEQQMKTWLAAHPKDHHGVHRYNMAQFGLDEDIILSSLPLNTRLMENFSL